MEAAAGLMVTQVEACPVCYESFAKAHDPPEIRDGLVFGPRMLECGDVVCSFCLMDELGEGETEYTCPLCFHTHECTEGVTLTVENFPAVTYRNPNAAPEPQQLDAVAPTPSAPVSGGDQPAVGTNEGPNDNDSQRHRAAPTGAGASPAEKDELHDLHHHIDAFVEHDDDLMTPEPDTGDTDTDMTPRRSSLVQSLSYKQLGITAIGEEDALGDVSVSEFRHVRSRDSRASSGGGARPVVVPPSDESECVCIMCYSSLDDCEDPPPKGLEDMSRGFDVLKEGRGLECGHMMCVSCLKDELDGADVVPTKRCELTFAHGNGGAPDDVCEGAALTCPECIKPNRVDMSSGIDEAVNILRRVLRPKPSPNKGTTSSPDAGSPGASATEVGAASNNNNNNNNNNGGNNDDGGTTDETGAKKPSLPGPESTCKSCMMCYEDFADGDEDLAGLRLACGHEFCMSCLRGEIDEGDEECTCSECFAATPLANGSIEDLLKVYVGSADPAPTPSDSTGAGDEGSSCSRAVSFKDTPAPGAKPSGLSAFLSTVKSTVEPKRSVSADSGASDSTTDRLTKHQKVRSSMVRRLSNASTRSLLEQFQRSRLGSLRNSEAFDEKDLADDWEEKRRLTHDAVMDDNMSIDTISRSRSHHSNTIDGFMSPRSYLSDAAFTFDGTPDTGDDEVVAQFDDEFENMNVYHDVEDSPVHPFKIMHRFQHMEPIEFGDAWEIVERTRRVLQREPNVLHVKAPFTVVGDLHGQYFDLVRIFEVAGDPPHTRYLFLGDYVDRGKYSCEVILQLLALKLTFPRHVYLLRGNHECATVSGHFGFKEECKAKYSLSLYYRLLLCFQCLPLCCVVHTPHGKVLAMHGGISPNVKTLDDIENIDRFVEPPAAGPLCDILWADPQRNELKDDAAGGGPHGSGSGSGTDDTDDTDTDDGSGRTTPMGAAAANANANANANATAPSENDDAHGHGRDGRASNDGMEGSSDGGYNLSGDESGESDSSSLSSVSLSSENGEDDEALYAPNPIRGCSFFFSERAARKFLKRNKLWCIVRAHEVQESGYSTHFLHHHKHRRRRNERRRGRRRPSLTRHKGEGPKLPAVVEGDEERDSDDAKPPFQFVEREDGVNISTCSIGFLPKVAPVITVFSAPNYCGFYGNKAALLQLGHGLVRRRGKSVDLSFVQANPLACDHQSLSIATDDSSTVPSTSAPPSPSSTTATGGANSRAQQSQPSPTLPLPLSPLPPPPPPTEDPTAMSPLSMHSASGPPSVAHPGRALELDVASLGLGSVDRSSVVSGDDLLDDMGFTRENSEIRWFQFDAAEEPEDASNIHYANPMDSIQSICPYMPLTFRDLVKAAKEMGPFEGMGSLLVESKSSALHGGGGGDRHQADHRGRTRKHLHDGGGRSSDIRSKALSALEEGDVDEESISTHHTNTTTEEASHSSPAGEGGEQGDSEAPLHQTEDGLGATSPAPRATAAANPTSGDSETTITPVATPSATSSSEIPDGTASHTDSPFSPDESPLPVIMAPPRAPAKREADSILGDEDELGSPTGRYAIVSLSDDTPHQIATRRIIAANAGSPSSNSPPGSSSSSNGAAQGKAATRSHTRARGFSTASTLRIAWFALFREIKEKDGTTWDGPAICNDIAVKRSAVVGALKTLRDTDLSRLRVLYEELACDGEFDDFVRLPPQLESHEDAEVTLSNFVGTVRRFMFSSLSSISSDDETDDPTTPRVQTYTLPPKRLTPPSNPDSLPSGSKASSAQPSAVASARSGSGSGGSGSSSQRQSSGRATTSATSTSRRKQATPTSLLDDFEDNSSPVLSRPEAMLRSRGHLSERLAPRDERSLVRARASQQREAQGAAEDRESRGDHSDDGKGAGLADTRPRTAALTGSAIKARRRTLGDEQPQNMGKRYVYASNAPPSTKASRNRMQVALEWDEVNEMHPEALNEQLMRGGVQHNQQRFSRTHSFAQLPGYSHDKALPHASSAESMTSRRRASMSITSDDGIADSHITMFGRKDKEDSNFSMQNPVFSRGKGTFSVADIIAVFESAEKRSVSPNSSNIRAAPAGNTAVRVSQRNIDQFKRVSLRRPSRTPQHSAASLASSGEEFYSASPETTTPTTPSSASATASQPPQKPRPVPESPTYKTEAAPPTARPNTNTSVDASDTNDSSEDSGFEEPNPLVRRVRTKTDGFIVPETTSEPVEVRARSGTEAMVSSPMKGVLALNRGVQRIREMFEAKARGASVDMEAGTVMDPALQEHRHLRRPPSIGPPSDDRFNKLRAMFEGNASTRNDTRTAVLNPRSEAYRRHRQSLLQQRRASRASMHHHHNHPNGSSHQHRRNTSGSSSSHHAHSSILSHSRSRTQSQGSDDTDDDHIHPYDPNNPEDGPVSDAEREHHGAGSRSSHRRRASHRRRSYRSQRSGSRSSRSPTRRVRSQRRMSSTGHHQHQHRHSSGSRSGRSKHSRRARSYSPTKRSRESRGSQGSRGSNRGGGGGGGGEGGVMRSSQKSMTSSSQDYDPLEEPQEDDDGELSDAASISNLFVGARGSSNISEASANPLHDNPMLMAGKSLLLAPSSPPGSPPTDPPPHPSMHLTALNGGSEDDDDGDADDGWLPVLPPQAAGALSPTVTRRGHDVCEVDDDDVMKHSKRGGSTTVMVNPRPPQPHAPGDAESDSSHGLTTVTEDDQSCASQTTHEDHNVNPTRAADEADDDIKPLPMMVPRMDSESPEDCAEAGDPGEESSSTDSGSGDDGDDLNADDEDRGSFERTSSVSMSGSERSRSGSSSSSSSSGDSDGDLGDADDMIDDLDDDDPGENSGATIFTAAELLSLKLLFAIMDQDGNECIEVEELARYAEESGDYAQRRELELIVEALDADGDGMIGLLDFILFAARRKEMSFHMQFQRVIDELHTRNSP